MTGRVRRRHFLRVIGGLSDSPNQRPGGIVDQKRRKRSSRSVLNDTAAFAPAARPSGRSAFGQKRSHQIRRRNQTLVSVMLRRRGFLCFLLFFFVAGD